MNIPSVTLNNGVKMPQIGLGVWQVEEGDEVKAAVSAALEAGYPAIDTAAAYGNEKGVGEALQASGLAREDIFITSKLWNADQGYDSTLRALDKSLELLGLEYLDLYLIHWPMPAQGKFVATWKAFEELYEQGRVKAIGVSNFREADLEKLQEQAKVVPAVNQIELHPRLSQQALRDYCHKHDIYVESWSPIMHGGTVLDDEVIKGIAGMHDKTPAQVVLRWHIQHDLIVIPKSVTPERIKENIDIFDFELSDDEMGAIDGLNSDERTGPDPAEMNS